jgi:hypothetical protein
VALSETFFGPHPFFSWCDVFWLTIVFSLFVTFALLSVASIFALLFFADYARKEPINGWLVPEQGMVRVLAPQPGVVTQLHGTDSRGS